MAKLTAWLITLLGVILVLGLLGLGFDWTNMYVQWLIAVIVLVVGICKLVKKLRQKEAKINLPFYFNFFYFCALY